MEIHRPAAERKAINRSPHAECALAPLTVTYRADHANQVSAATVNGYVSATDPSIGHPARIFLLTVAARREAFTGLELLDLSWLMIRGSGLA